MTVSTVSTMVPSGAADVDLQFGTTADSSDDEVTSTNYTLDYPGSLSFEDVI